MTTALEHYRERLRQATERMTALRDALAAERGRARAPIAVVGLGCRLPPDVADPEAFFDGLLAGAGGPSPAPVERYGAAAADLPPGGYLREIRAFDAAFFGVSPREAAAIDPQHRLLLEVVWEALERAGLPPASLPAERVGVFLGIAGGDYLPRALAGAEDLYPLTGNGGAFASGRLAFSLGFRGPCLAVDTACSSSLVAVHLAVQSLRRGECDVAVVAGVNLVIEPATTRLLLASGALARDGRCKTFDAAADGFARAEGAVAAVLQRLDDARRGAAPVQAVIRGSAVNHDGRGAGLTAPSVDAQAAMLAAALQDAQVPAESVGYVETHGTGTALGDPIEFDALRAIFGARRGPLPCVLGAVKTHVGHLEAGAGLLGLLKATLCLRRRQIPRNLHFTAPSPHLDLTGTPFVLPTTTLEFPAAAGGPRRAGVSAFGMSGTNAHVVLEEAPDDAGAADPATERVEHGGAAPLGPDRAASAGVEPEGAAPRAGAIDDAPGLLTLSARHPRALAELAAGVAGAIERGEAPPRAARTAALHRSHHPHRLALSFAAGDDVAAALRAFAAGDPAAEVEAGEAIRRDGPVFVCAGQGTAWAGMGRELYALPAARALLEAAAPGVAEHGGFDLRAALCDDDAPLARTEVAQPAIVAVTLAIAAALAAHGVRPAAVIGHSVGEIAAAHLAGALPLAEALRLACVRGRAMGRAARGALLAVSLGPEATAERIAAAGGRLEIAAVNGPRATVIGGDVEAITAVAKRLAADGVRCRRVDVDHAFHTAAMAPILPDFAAAIDPLPAGATRCPLYSVVTGARIAGEALDVGHWQAGIRRVVRFQEALAAAIADDHRLFLDVGPHPVLGAAALGDEGRAVTTLRRGADARRALLRALGGLYVAGAPVDLGPLYPGRAPLAALPTYPWQRRIHWIERPDGEAAAPARAPAEDEAAAAATGAASPRERHAIERRVRAEIAAILRLAPDEPIPAHRGLFELGFDSMLAVELARRLARAFERPLGPTLAFDHPTLSALVDHLCDADADDDGAAGRRAPTRAPIAVIGVACRLPGGANDPEAFWRLLVDGREAIAEVPPDRWDRDAYYDPDPQAAGAMYVTRAGFLAGVDLRAFDAECFSIAPAEARSLDPQQRLLLELTYEALEDAGRPIDRLVGSRTGIYVGIATSDYGQQLARRPLAEIEPSFATGCALNTAAGRLAFVLGARGPALALDTACSSSLVALHLAVESLRRGETDLALVAGTNLMLDPAIGVMYSRMGALAPDGRCKAFDAAADGMVRGEGAAVVVLARLADARLARDRVRAIVRGAAVNHDGRSSGLTVPSGPAQRAVIRDALADAGVAATDITYVEAHGTGTRLGDPIEAGALLAELGPGRPADRPLVVGSAKANVGHLEPAAGLVGLIKVVLALGHRTIPGQPTFTRLNPAIDPGEVPLVVPTAARPWAGPRLAGVSAFGISGTNAHVIVAAADEGPDDAPAAAAPTAAPSPREAAGEARGDAAPPLLLPISARREDALAALVDAWRARLIDAGDDAPLAELCAAAALRRAHPPQRMIAVGGDRAALVAALDAWRRGDAEHPGWAAGVAQDAPRLAFVFSGHGGHWVGMGRRLLAGEPTFARAFRECDERLANLSPGTSLVDALTADDAEARWRSKSVLHPLMLALQVALAAFWRSLGVTPAAVVGHSSGELAAAVAAGALTLDDALRVSLARCAAIETIVGRGMMAAVGLPPDEAEAALADLAGQATIAVHNAPRQVVISGDTAAITALGRRLAARDVYFKAIPGADGAGHSHHLDPTLPGLRAALADLRPGAAAIPFYSTVTAGPHEGPLDAAYWARNLRERVRFAEAAARLVADGVGVFLEIGPHPVLLPAIAQLAPSAAGIASLRRGGDDRVSLRAALGRLHVAGLPIEWRRIYPGPCPALPLPRHPWHRTTHWMPPARGAATPGRHPLIQRELTLARGGEQVIEGSVEADRADLPAPTEVQGVRVVEPALLLELVGAALGGDRAPVALELGPALPFTRGVALQLTLADGGAFEVFARVDDEGWARVGGGQAAPPAAPPAADLAALQGRCPRRDDGHRARQRARGLHLPPALDAVDAVWRGDGEALARLRPLGGRWAGVAATASALHLLGAQALPADDAAIAGELAWPRAIAAVTPITAPPAWIHVALRGPAGDDGRATGDVTFLGGDGRPVGALRGVALGAPGRALARRTVAAALDQWAYTIAWEALDPGGGAAIEPGRWLVVAGDDAAAAGRLAAALGAGGHAAGVVAAGDGPSLAAAVRAARQAGPLRGVVDLRGLAARDFARSPASGAPTADAGAHDGGAIPRVSADLGPTPRGDRPADDLDADALALIERARVLVAEGVPRLALVTCGGQAVAAGEAPDPAAAIVWGIGRAIGLEHPEVAVRLLDLDPAGPDLEAAAREVLAPDGEDLLAHRGGQRLGARLTRAAVAIPAAPLRFDPGGTWLITGGLGGIGLHLARWLVDRGARRLLLVSRGGADTPARAAAVAALRGAGADVQVAAVDVADGPAMAALIEGLPADRPLRGVFHAAGVTRFEALAQTTPAAVRAVLRAKVAGAQVLDRLTRGRPLAAFVCFSSVAATWGAAGLAVYGAANHYLELLAQRRRAEGLPGLSIAWGGWSGGGMTERATIVGAAQLGLGAAPPEPLLEAMDACMQADVARLSLAIVDWARFKAVLEARGERPLLRRIAAPAAVAGDGPLARALRARAGAERWPALREAVAGRVAEVLGLADPADLDPQRGFFQLGMDSMMTVRLRRALADDSGVALPPTLVLEQPTVERLARWLAGELGVDAPRAAPPPDDPPGDPPGDPPADALAEQSEDALEALLAAELADAPEDHPPGGRHA